MGGEQQLSGPDLSQGILLSDIPDSGMLVGHVAGEGVLVVRRGEEIFAIGSACTHYGGPLGEGLVVGDTVRCPWHHACFSVRTGEPLRPPALGPAASWRVERDGTRIIVRDKNEGERPRQTNGGPASVVNNSDAFASKAFVSGQPAGCPAVEMHGTPTFAATSATIVSSPGPPMMIVGNKVRSRTQRTTSTT